MELLLNESFGGFGISQKAYQMLADKKQVKYDELKAKNIQDYRTDKDLIDVFKELGSKINNQYSDLHLVNLPDGSDYTIEDNYGAEQVYYSAAKLNHYNY